MPKYYVSDGIELGICDAEDAFNACLKLIENGIFNTIMVGGYYFVSERGFCTDLRRQELHEIINSDSVNCEYLLRKMDSWDENGE